jgi:hypothetical protein
MQGGSIRAVQQAGTQREPRLPPGAKQGLSRLLGTGPGAGVGKAAARSSGRGRGSQPKGGGRRQSIGSKQPLGTRSAFASQDMDGLFVQPELTGRLGDQQAGLQPQQGGFARFAFGQAG